jgi:hypothetical protein
MRVFLIVLIALVIITWAISDGGIHHHHHYHKPRVKTREATNIY